MSITVNLYYTGRNGAARRFAEEMTASGTVAAIRQEEGNLQYEYFFPMEDEETVLLIDSWADQAALEMRRVDRDRKAYHNYYCDTKWGDARGYDLVVNSGKLGIEKTVDTLVTYVRAYQAQNE